jgi:hypothetical protein
MRRQWRLIVVLVILVSVAFPALAVQRVALVIGIGLALKAPQGLAEIADAEVGLCLDCLEPGLGKRLADQARIVRRVDEQIA